uniref:Uncharacterized protein n=1 Tax=Rhizophora mucronata TaxID=61149 RepID=A0A2P2QCF4_RHIMU
MGGRSSIHGFCTWGQLHGPSERVRSLTGVARVLWVLRPKSHPFFF